MKASKIDRVISEWQNERTIVEVCASLISDNHDGQACYAILIARAKMLGEMIGRASSIDEGAEERTAKPTRTRKARKSTEQAA